MAQRGRPKLLPRVEPNTLETKVAEFLNNNCYVPGCSAKHHLEEAREIIALIKGDK